MAKLCRNAFTLATKDLAKQFALPFEPLEGQEDPSKIFAEQTGPLNKLVIDSLNISKGDKVLELGYGRGDGIEYCFQKLDGEGSICGTERSHYMKEIAQKRFSREIAESRFNGVNWINYASFKSHPRPFFDSIYHVDFYYFIYRAYLRYTCTDMMHFLKPGGRVVCGIEIERLELFTEWGIIRRSEWDPKRYISYLERAKFQEITIDNIDDPSGRRYQLISARKPEDHEDRLIIEREEKKLEKKRLLLEKKRLLLEKKKKAGGVLKKEELEFSVA